jgi:multimeric flavodoxin WrbA
MPYRSFHGTGGGNGPDIHANAVRRTVYDVDVRYSDKRFDRLLDNLYDSSGFTILITSSKGRDIVPKKMTILLGSPRRNGNSETLATSFSGGAAKAGYKATSIRINGLKIGGCIDCRRCWSNRSHCFLNDDMKEVYAAIDKADALVFVTPLYFYSWSTQIKPVWDRLLPYFSPNSKVDIKGRRAALIATAGDDDESCFEGLRKSFELACNYAKWEITGELLVPGVHEASAVSGNEELLKRAFEAGKNL